jgi:serine protease
VIVYNIEPGLINGGLGFDSPIPVALIEQAEGEAVLSKLTQKTPVEASVKVFATDYASFSGTSMATPHVAGVAALMKAARPDLTPVEVKNILQKTAQLMAASTQNETGSGLVNAEAGVQAAVDLSR